MVGPLNSSEGEIMQTEDIEMGYMRRKAENEYMFHSLFNTSQFATNSRNHRDIKKNLDEDDKMWNSIMMSAYGTLMLFLVTYFGALIAKPDFLNARPGYQMAFNVLFVFSMVLIVCATASRQGCFFRCCVLVLVYVKAVMFLLLVFYFSSPRHSPWIAFFGGLGFPILLMVVKTIIWG